MNKETLSNVFDTRVTDTRDNWKLLCPFHLESTPSFYIHKDDLVGHCFGCNVAGRLDLLVARLFGGTPAAARERLGLTHLPWLDPKEEKYVEPTYPSVWIHAWKRIRNHPYLSGRGFRNETVEHFEMRWDPKDKRVVWPLIRPEGKIVGAVGRATDGREPKYRFYWNCDKGQSLWTHASFWAESPSTVIVVEGILDAMWMWQAGLRNTVALIGAQATKAQRNQLKEFDRVILALDNDKAGRIGALTIGEALKTSCDVEYALYPDGRSDANDLTAEELQQVFAGTVTPLEMKLHG